MHIEQFKELLEQVKKLLSTLRDREVMDGEIHPGENILDEIVRIIPVTDQTKELLALFQFITDRVSLVKLLGRCTHLTINTQKELLTEWLQDVIIIRDAGMQAAETWDPSSTLIDILEKHKEPVAWLADYKEKVISSMKAALVPPEHPYP